MSSAITFRVRTPMGINQLLIADLVFFGMVCSAYLQYKAFKAVAELPARSDRRGRGLSRTEIVKTVEGLAYGALGIGFETSCLAKALLG
jgi:hypothetical protein